MRRVGLALIALLTFVSAAQAEIVGAEYQVPTGRYGHGALGSGSEWARLVLTISDGPALRFTLPADAVFEDTAPRIADVTGDGVPEVVTVESHARHGARIAVYSQAGRIITSPYIGTRFRWLAVAGIADFDGDGAVEIAAVDRPHLAKTLRYWRVDGSDLVEVASLPGVTNHAYGSPNIEGGLRECEDRAALIMADARWNRILSIEWDGDEVRATDIGPYHGPESLTAAQAC